MSDSSGEGRRYGTFEGVFTPTIITILGVIMFLRQGWVVGNAGLGGAWLVILLAFAITGATGLSLSSIVSNIRIGAGGAYSIITQSLGREAGGGVGIPLFLAQALVVTLYIFGFREGWLYVFPDHPALVVDLVAFGVLFVIAFVSARLAFRVQYGIMAVIAAALVSVAVAALQGPTGDPIDWWGDFPGKPEKGFEGISFWGVFAVFFPAATGILAGVNMSGELRQPRRSIPLGMMSAIGVSLVIYLALALWFDREASPRALSSDFTLMIELSAFGPAVLAGLLGATFSSALAALVGAPRVLQAIAEDRVIPRLGWLARRSRSGEPHNAMIVTGAVVLAALMARELNAVAPVITMFFLITYGMINAVVLIEQSLGLVTFRPLVPVPRVVPLFGTLGCLFAMVVVSWQATAVAFIVVGTVYAALTRRRLRSPAGDVRAGVFMAIASWAAQRAERRGSVEKAWKPDLLVPVSGHRGGEADFDLLRSVTHPSGSVRLLAIAPDESDDDAAARLEPLVERFRSAGVAASWTGVEGPFEQCVVASMQALRVAIFHPNAVFLRVRDGDDANGELTAIVEEAGAAKQGVLLFIDDPRRGLGDRHTINVWIDPEPSSAAPESELEHRDLAVLVGLQIARNWEAQINLVAIPRREDEPDQVESYLGRLKSRARLPWETKIFTARQGEDLEAIVARVPRADLTLFSLTDPPDFGSLPNVAALTDSACLFLRDSGRESALA